MATGDILDCTILADGWHADIEIEGLGTGGTYLLDASNADLQDRSTAKVVFTVTSEGYDDTGSLGTFVRTVRGTIAQRQEYPNEASNEESTSGSDVIVRVVLDDYIYDDDKDGGAGTSGTDVTVTILADFYTEGGTGSNATTDLTCTNNSTQDYPQAYGQWDHPDFQRPEADFRMAFTARHRYGIAAVRFDADGATSANNENATVTSETARLRPATGLYHGAHETTIDVSGFTQAEFIDLRARAYPKVGDANSICDTDDHSALDPITNRAPQTFRCDKNSAVSAAKYVSPTGNDSTGDGSSGSPYLTIAKALSTSALVIYLEAGTYLLGTPPSAPADYGVWQVVTAAPGEDKTTVLVKCSSDRDLDAARVCFRDVEFQPDSSGSWIDGENANRWLWFDDCDMQDNGITPTVGVAYRSRGVWFTNCVGTPWKVDAFSSSRLLHSFDGCEFGGKIRNIYRLVACKSDGESMGSTPFVTLDKQSATSGDECHEGQLIENNQITDFTSTAKVIEMGTVSALTLGASLSGNIVEGVSVGDALFWLYADSVTLACNNLMVLHNTTVGDRWNCMYNDVGSTPSNVDLPLLRFNAGSDFATKHDLFGTPNGNRIGAWPCAFGVGALANFFDDLIVSGSFVPEYVGFLSDHAAVESGMFEDDQSEQGGAAGNGDYAPAAASPLRDVIPSGEEILSFDLFGTARPNDGTGAVGAVQPPAVPAGLLPFNFGSRPGLAHALRR